MHLKTLLQVNKIVQRELNLIKSKYCNMVRRINNIHLIISRVLAVRPARRTDASAPLSAGAASPPPPLPLWHGEGRICCT